MLSGACRIRGREEKGIRILIKKQRIVSARFFDHALMLKDMLNMLMFSF